jgi:hypothetical protein
LRKHVDTPEYLMGSEGRGEERERREERGDETWEGRWERREERGERREDLREERGGGRGPDGQRLLVHPLACVVAADGLLRSSDEVLIFSVSCHLVKLFVKLLKLCHTGHHILAHQVGGLQHTVYSIVYAGNRRDRRVRGV